MKTQASGLQAFTQTAAQLSRNMVKDGESSGMLGQSGDCGSDVAQLHSQVSRELSRKFGLHPKGVGVPLRFSRDPNVEIAFASGMNWNMFRPEYFVLYNVATLRSYFEDGQYTYPAKTDAQFSIPTGVILLYMFAHEITHALHWMRILEGLPSDFMYQDTADKFLVQLNRFHDDTESKPFVEGLAELGALTYLRNAGHPVARKFATLHFTTRMIEAAHYMDQPFARVRDAFADVASYFLRDDEQVAVHDLAVQCSEHYPDWIVGQQRYEGGWNNPLHYAVGLLKVGELVFSEGTSVPELMQLDLRSDLVVKSSRA